MQHLPSTRRLQLFEQLGRRLNFHRTADAVGIAQPALTRAIKQLEDELGFDLFARTSRSTQLTPAGQVFHLRVQQWLHDLDAAIRDCRELAHGGGQRRLVLGYSAQASQGRMSKHLFQFGLGHADVDLNLRQLPSEAAYEAIASGDLQGAFLLHEEESLSRLGLSFVPVERQSVVVLCSASHPLARRKRISVQDLGRWGLATGSETRWQVFRRTIFSRLAQLGVTARVVYEADDTPLLLEAIAQSDNVGLYGSAIVNQLPNTLVALELKESFELPICFAYAAKTDGPALDLARFLEEALRSARRTD